MGRREIKKYTINKVFYARKEANSMKELLGREVKIGDKEGEITNILGVGYEVTFFNINEGKIYIDSREIEKYLV